MNHMQERRLAHGLGKTLERVNSAVEVNLTVRVNDKFEFMRKLRELPGVVSVTDEAERIKILENEVAKLNQRLTDAQLFNESLMQFDEYRREVAQQKSTMNLRNWAQSVNISYSTAYRALTNNEIEGYVSGGGTKNKTWLVYPDTYRPVLKKRGRKKRI
jgi:hypothetical protein